MSQESYKYYLKMEGEETAQEVSIEVYREMIKEVSLVHGLPDLFSGITRNKKGKTRSGTRVEGFIARKEGDFERYKHGIKAVNIEALRRELAEELASQRRIPLDCCLKKVD